MFYLVGFFLPTKLPFRSFITLLLCGLVFIALPINDALAAYTAKPDYASQRKNYIKAVRALKQQDYETYDALSKDLVDYPLYSYLRFHYLTSLSQITQAQISDLKNQINNPHIAHSLDLFRVENLGRNKQWKKLISEYASVANKTTVLDCYYGEALYHEARYTEAFAIAEEKWPVAYSQPKECDALFSLWLRQPGKPGRLAWERYRKAIRYGEHNIADYVYKRFLGKSYKAYADVYNSLRKNPELIKDLELNINDRLHQEFFYSALRTLVNSDVDYVRSQLARADIDQWLTPYRIQKIEQSMAILDIRKGIDGALDAAINAKIDKKVSYFDELTFQYYLHREEWENVLAFIDSHSGNSQDSESMQYWRARALEQSEASVNSANEIYQKLSDNRSYYGFLAADRLQKPYRIELGSHSYDKAFLSILAKYPGVVRAYELFALDNVDAAEKEWAAVMSTLGRQEKVAATVLAFQWGMYHFAINSAVDAEAYRFLSTRYPLAHRRQFEKLSAQLDINADWLMAIARQESAFDHKAVSSANARGLMQIIPDTAKETAEQFSLSYNSVNDLFKPATNITVGSHYLDAMSERFSNNRILATASYNAGPHRVENWIQYASKPLPADIWIELIPFSETRNYVKRVLTNNVIYQHRLEKEPTLLQANETLIYKEQDTYFVQSKSKEAAESAVLLSEGSVVEPGRPPQSQQEYD